MADRPQSEPTAVGSRQLSPADLPRPWLRAEVVVVLWVSLGAAAVRSGLDLLQRLTSGVPLDEQTARLVAPVAADRPWLDLAYQLSFIVLPLGAVALVAYLLARSGESLRTIGFDLSRPGSDVGRGAVLAAAVGGAGLVFYLVAQQAGLAVQIAAAQVGAAWWDWPLLLLRAAENAVLEEVVVLGFLLHRLQQRGMRGSTAVVVSALLRGSYHLYQGLSGFLGNFVMGLLFGWLFHRWGRVGPMVVAHFLIDAVAFVGYAALADTLDWLP